MKMPSTVGKARSILVGILLLGIAVVAADEWLKAHGVGGGLAYWFEELLVPVGQALIVGALVGVTVDASARLQFIKDVAKDGLGYILGHDLSPVMQAQLKELILDRILRRNVRMRFSLTGVAGQPQQYSLVVHLEFDLLNLSLEPVDFEPRLEEEAHEQVKVLYVACDSPEGMKFSEENPAITRVDGIDKLAHKPSRVRKIAPGQQPYKYRLGYSVGTPRRDKDFAIFSFAGMTEDVNLSVEAPSELIVGVYPSRASTNKNVWEFQDVFMKGQHVTVYWRPRGVGDRNDV